MKAYSEAIGNLRTRIKDLTEKARENRAEIAQLKEQPDTGVERCSLRSDYCTYTRSEARHVLLAYALLRGRPYLALERKCVEEPSPNRILKKIQEAFGEDYPDFSLQTILDWLKGKVEQRAA
jgi:hypothetical protein